MTANRSTHARVSEPLLVWPQTPSGCAEQCFGSNLPQYIAEYSQVSVNAVLLGLRRSVLLPKGISGGARLVEAFRPEHVESVRRTIL